MDEDAVRDMVAELRATRAELSDALNVLAQIEQAVGGKVPSRLFRLIGWMCAGKETDGRD